MASEEKAVLPKEESRPYTWRQFVAFLLFLFPLTFGMFHFFIFSFWYYWSIAPEVPIVLSSVLIVVFIWRIGAFIPFPQMYRRENSIGWPQKVRSLGSLSSVVELFLWYLALILFYAHLVRRFDFPKSLEHSNVWAPILLGYLAYFIVALTFFPLLSIFGTGFWKLIHEFRRFKYLIKRISTVFAAYVLVDIFFGAIFRLSSILYPDTFDPPIGSAIDALYFSTVTISTLGYGDVKPVSALGKIMVIGEILIGVLLIAVVLALAISISLTEKDSKEEPQANRELMPKSKE